MPNEGLVLMAYDSFESVESLDTDAQRELLLKGDCVERVWAAWALGLKLGTKIIPELLECLSISTFPGTRRHLIAVLAGLGELSILEPLAKQDPDEYVRATACQYLIRTARPHTEGLQEILHDRLLQDESPTVRLAVLQEGEKFLVNFHPEHFKKLLRDPDAEVRHTVEKYFLPSSDRTKVL